MNIVEFLETQLAEDEAVARAATAGPWISYGSGIDGADRQPVIMSGWDSAGSMMDAADAEDLAHVARHNPARVLAECKAKRAIVAEHTNPHGYGFCPVCWDSAAEEPLPANCPTLRALAAIYKDRPGFRKEWE